MAGERKEPPTAAGDADQTEKRPEEKAEGGGSAREARLAKALRENLRRRKTR